MSVGVSAQEFGRADDAAVEDDRQLVTRKGEADVLGPLNTEPLEGHADASDVEGAGEGVTHLRGVVRRVVVAHKDFHVLQREDLALE
jgi:hypothetical protein